MSEPSAGDERLLIYAPETLSDLGITLATDAGALLGDLGSTAPRPRVATHPPIASRIAPLHGMTYEDPDAPLRARAPRTDSERFAARAPRVLTPVVTSG
jgi:hypothetical protein